METIADRFWPKVQKAGPDECWLWTASKATTGYGQLNASKTAGPHRMFHAHRVSYELAHGPIPSGLWVLHKCDVRHCVNPAHLYLGNVKDNARDMVERGRHSSRTHPERIPRGDRHPSRLRPETRPRGERNPAAKLRDEQVREIRARYDGIRGSLTRLAREYCVDRALIRLIVDNKIWRHVA